MNRKKRTALWILLALAAVIGGLCIWQRDNLRALVLSRSIRSRPWGPITAPAMISPSR